MLEIGRFNTLTIEKISQPGCFLDGGDKGRILLPKRYCEEDFARGDSLEVFVYRDSEDRLIATTEIPKVMVNQVAYLKVVETNKVGAFLDWGLPKDLLLPFSEQQNAVTQGFSYVVYMFLDIESERLVASTRLEDHLSQQKSTLKRWDQVDILIYGKSDLGFKAVINHTHLGQLYDNEVFQKLYFGQQIKAYIKNVRHDGKIDLSLQLPEHRSNKSLTDQILDHLKSNENVSHITDHSLPDVIYQTFSVSKAKYKKALSSLYKARQINIAKDKITLITKAKIKK